MVRRIDRGECVPVNKKPKFYSNHQTSAPPIRTLNSPKTKNVILPPSEVPPKTLKVPATSRAALILILKICPIQIFCSVVDRRFPRSVALIRYYQVKNRRPSPGVRRISLGLK